MKKLLLSLLTVVSLSAFAQKDLEVTLLSPAQGRVITKNTPITFGAQFTNVGMDSIKVQDTILIQFLIEGNPLSFNFGQGPVSIFRVSHPTIFKDSSIFLNLPPVNLNPSAIDSAEICIVFDLTNVVRQDNSLDNNEDCNTVFLSFPTAVTELNNLAQSIKAFPNPASNYFTLTMKSAEATVDVMDITGKLIETNVVTLGEARFDVSNYNNGVYFYQVKTNEGKVAKSGKFTVAH